MSDRRTRPQPFYAPSPTSYVQGPICVVVGLLLLANGHLLGGLAVGCIGTSAVMDIIEHHTGVSFGRWGWIMLATGVAALVAFLALELLGANSR